jgi:hypothetical protein
MTADEIRSTISSRVDCEISVSRRETVERVEEYNHANENPLEDERWATVQIVGDKLIEWIKEQVPIDEDTEATFIEALIYLGNSFRIAAGK